MKLQFLQRLSRINIRSLIANLFKITIALVLIVFVLSQTTVEEIIRAFENVSLPWLVFNVLIFYVVIWFMARRYWRLIGEKVPFRSTLTLTVTQTLIGNLIATSAGAVSYVAILKGKYQVRISEGVTSLIQARVLDLFLLFIGLSISSWVLWSQIDTLHLPIVMLIVFMSICFLFVLLFLIYRKQFSKWFGWIFARFRFWQKLFMAFDNRDADRLTIYSFFHISNLLYTSIIFVLMAAYLYSGMRIFSLNLGFWNTLFILSLNQLIVMIPIRFLGGLGIFEVTMFYLLGLFFQEFSIIPILVGFRIIFYITNLLLLPYLLVVPRLAGLKKKHFSAPSIYTPDSHKH